MSLQGLPDPHIVAARAEKKRVLAEQKVALDALERRQKQSIGEASGTEPRGGSLGSAPPGTQYRNISIDDELANEDELDVYAMEAEMQDNKFWFIQEAQLNAEGIGSAASRRNKRSSIEEQLRRQMGLQKDNTNATDDDGINLTQRKNDSLIEDNYANFQEDIMHEKWGVVGKDP